MGRMTECPDHPNRLACIRRGCTKLHEVEPDERSGRFVVCGDGLTDEECKAVQALLNRMNRGEQADPEVERLRSALQDIANVDPVDAALDPTRPLRIAEHALKEKAE